MKIATFHVDITPPRGFPMAYGRNEKTDAPIFVRGALVNDGKSTAVMAAADVIFIGGRAHKELRKAIAKAAGTKPGNVFLHAVHQHEGPVVAALLGDPRSRQRHGLKGIARRSAGCRRHDRWKGVLRGKAAVVS